MAKWGTPCSPDDGHQKFLGCASADAVPLVCIPVFAVASMDRETLLLRLRGSR